MIRMLRDYPGFFNSLLEGLRYRAKRNEHLPDKDWDELDNFHEPLANEDQQAGYMRALDDMKRVLCGDTEKVEEKLVELYCWVPECGFPLEKTFYDEEVTDESHAGTPFFSEHYLYDLIGKQDARTVLALVRQVAEAAGIDRMGLRQRVSDAFEAQEKVRLQEVARREATGWRFEFWDECLRQSAQVEGKVPFDGRCLIPFCDHGAVDIVTPRNLLCPRHMEMALKTGAKNSVANIEEAREEGDEKRVAYCAKRIIGWTCEADDGIYVEEKANRPTFPPEA